MLQRILIILLLTTPVFAASQSRDLQRADSFYNRFKYPKALSSYLKAEKKGESVYYVTRRIGDCYRHMKMPEKAVEWYQRTLTFPDVEPDTYFHLGQLLRTLGRYDESDGYLTRFYTLTRTQAAFRGLSPEDHLNSILSDSGRVEIMRLDINTRHSEFAPAIWNNKLVFMSNRPGSSPVRTKDARSRESFFDLYAAQIKSLTTFGRPELFDSRLKTSLNDGPVSFSADGQQAYITRNTGRTVDGVSELDIVVARFRDGQWQKNTTTLPFKIRGFSIAHPATTHNNERIYFASDMPGGYGGMDLYYSERRDGFLSQPVNMGPLINTPGNEIFPYVDEKGRLFFASDGHPGLGGLDIFVALPTPDGFAEPINPGPGINSSHDDFTIAFNEDGLSGYFASNRPSGSNQNNQNDNLYAFRMIRPLEFTMIDGFVRNQSTGAPEAEVTISVSKSDGTLVSTFESDEKGRFLVHLLSDVEYKFTFRKRMMEPYEKSITPTDMKGYASYNLQVSMSPR